MTRLAINRLRDGKPDAAAVDRFLARHEVPIVEGPRCTFLWRGEADAVHLVQRIVGLPDKIPLRRLWGTDLWYAVLELPEGSRINYRLEVRNGDHIEGTNDPLNPKVSYSPVGTSSVCFAHGYHTPDWTFPDPDARPGELTEMVVRSRALRRDTRVQLYLPARFRRAATYPLLVVHDGSDFLQYAAAKTVLDNLIHRLDVAEVVVAFVDPHDRLAEYANSAGHARYVTRELVPHLEAELPRDVAGVAGRVRVLGQPIVRVHERDHDLRHVEPVDQVVQHRLHRGIPEVVGAVVHHQQGVALRAVEARRQVEVHRLVPAQRLAPQDLLDHLARPRLRVGPHPVRHLVADGRADRARPHGAVGDPGVEGVVEPLVVLAAAQLELVLHA